MSATRPQLRHEQAIKKVSLDVEKAITSRVALAPPSSRRFFARPAWVGAGEQTGKIDVMLEKMADFWDEEVAALLNALTSLIEPHAIIVVLGHRRRHLIALFCDLLRSRMSCRER